MANEAGGHRIQRVPEGEKRGRVHSSTVTVSVLDEEDGPSEPLREGDLRYRWFSGTGAGGQHRNKKQCSLELIHLPTGISRTVQSRSREDNAREAREALEIAVADLARTASHRSRNETRSAQIGSGERSDKRRTYRFQEDRVTDHVTGRTIKASRFMRGDVAALWPEGRKDE